MMARAQRIASWCLLTLSVMSSPARAAVRYTRYKLFELIASADVVVAGRISALHRRTEFGPGFALSYTPATIDVAVEDKIWGEPSDLIRVRCFQNWTCAARWTSYAVGQRVVLFLSRPDQGSQTYDILGAGGEGEMPLIDKTICVRGYSVRGFEPREIDTDDAQVEGSCVPLEEFEHAVRGFRDTYKWELLRSHGLVTSIQPRRSADEVAKFTASSRTARHLYEEAVSSEVWHGEQVGVVAHPFPTDCACITASVNGLQGRTRLAPGRVPDQFGFELYSEFGSSCAFLGDVNGDGVEDIAVGAPKDSYLGHFHGALWIGLLDSSSSARRWVEIREGMPGFPFHMGEFADFGVSVVGLGDLNGDGIPDLAVGATRWSEAGHSRGGVWILSLTREATIARAVEIGGDPKCVEAGVYSEAGFGCSIANLGDIDGDGYPELAIGQEPSFDTGLKNGRRVFIVSLGAGGVVRWVKTLHDKSDGFSQDYSWFGYAVAGIGDVDGDGVPDLAISNIFDSDGGKLRGAVWIVFLKRDGSMKAQQKISCWHGRFDGILHDDSNFGRALCAPGDIDGDGVPDLLVTSTEGIWTLLLSRDGAVRASTLTAPPRDGFAAGARIGRSIAARRMRTPTEPIGLAVGGMINERLPTRDAAVWFPRVDAQGNLR
jgi:hypothetical protein